MHFQHGKLDGIESASRTPEFRHNIYAILTFVDHAFNGFNLAAHTIEFT